MGKKIIIIKELISLFMQNRFKPETETKVQDWIIDERHAKEKNEALFEEFESLQYKATAETQSSLMNVKKLIVRSEEQKPKKVFLRTYWRQATAVAAMVAIGAIGSFYYMYEKPLHNWKLNEVATLNGETKNLILSDSSNVWINAGSSIKYTGEKTEKKRIVELSGEAYFSVTKDKEKPFVVKTEDLSIIVIGTKFNVKAYPSEDKTIVSLDEGKINVEIATNEIFTLNPGQQLIYDKKTRIVQVVEIEKNCIGNNSGWKSGYFVIESANIKEITLLLERYYNIKIETTGLSQLDNNEVYSIKFKKNESINNVLYVLKELIKGFSYRIDGNIVYIEEN